VRNGTGESPGKDANPDGGVGVVTFSVLDGLDEWDIIVSDVFLFLSIVVVVVVVLLDLLVHLLVDPCETNEIDR
jgi:hypothetical protein